MTARDDQGRGPPKGHPVRRAVQAAGFIIGLVLLWWCAREALSDKNREQLAKLGEAEPWQVAAVAGLTAASLLLNGTLFWVTLLPVRRLRWADVAATNIIASLLALLPFKLSVLFRVLVHRGRDGVGLLTIGAWFGAMAAVLSVVILPVALAAGWAAGAAERGVPAPPWWPWAAAGGVTVAAAAMVGVSWAPAHERGWPLVERMVRLVPGARAREAVRLALLPRAHEGARMLGAPGPVAAAVALRLVDIGVQTVRLLVAASIVGQALPLELAVLAASAYFMIGVLALMGSLGVREAGTAGVFALLASEEFMVVVIMVTAAETAVLLGGAVLAGLWLRVDRLLLRRINR